MPKLPDFAPGFPYPNNETWRKRDFLINKQGHTVRTGLYLRDRHWISQCIQLMNAAIDTNQEINTSALLGKQNTLTAGSGITLNGATISSPVPTVTAYDSSVEVYEVIHNTGVEYQVQAKVSGTTDTITSVTSTDGSVKITETGSGTANINYDVSVPEVTSVSYAANAGTAVQANNADTASFASSAVNATNALNANFATTAGSAATAGSAVSASQASNASTANFATNAGQASLSSLADLSDNLNVTLITDNQDLNTCIGTYPSLNCFVSQGAVNLVNSPFPSGAPFTLISRGTLGTGGATGTQTQTAYATISGQAVAADRTYYNGAWTAWTTQATTSYANSIAVSAATSAQSAALSQATSYASSAATSAQSAAESSASSALTSEGVIRSSADASLAASVAALYPTSGAALSGSTGINVTSTAISTATGSITSYSVGLQAPVTPSNGGTGVAGTLVGVPYANGTGAMTNATSSQAAALLGSAFTPNQAQTSYTLSTSVSLNDAIPTSGSIISSALGTFNLNQVYSMFAPPSSNTGFIYLEPSSCTIIWNARSDGMTGMSVYQFTYSISGNSLTLGSGGAYDSAILEGVNNFSQTNNFTGALTTLNTIEPSSGGMNAVADSAVRSAGLISIPTTVNSFANNFFGSSASWAGYFSGNTLSFVSNIVAGQIGIDSSSPLGWSSSSVGSIEVVGSSTNIYGAVVSGYNKLSYTSSISANPILAERRFSVSGGVVSYTNWTYRVETDVVDTFWVNIPLVSAFNISGSGRARYRVTAGILYIDLFGLYCSNTQSTGNPVQLSATGAFNYLLNTNRPITTNLNLPFTGSTVSTSQTAPTLGTAMYPQGTTNQQLMLQLDTNGTLWAVSPTAITSGWYFTGYYSTNLNI